MFYVYLLIDPSTNIPFYVGKGKGKRYAVHFNPSSAGQNPLKDAKIRKIIERDEAVTIKQIPCDSEESAYKLEMQLIDLYGRLDLGTGSLTNLQGGGEGAGSERIMTESTRTKIATSKKNQPCAAATSEKIANTIQQSGSVTSVIQYTLDGIEVARYPSARAASKATGVDGSHILYCCSGKYPHAKGFIWKYQYPEHHVAPIKSKKIKTKIEKCDGEWNVIEVFESCSQAAKSLGTGTSYIARVSKNNDFAFGFYWRRA